MAKPYDATTKRLIELHPQDWLALLGLPGNAAQPLEVELVDSDLSTISLQADRVLKILSPEPYLTHFEMIAGHHGEQAPPELLRYSVLLSGKYRLVVRSAVILLRREADSPALTGLLEYRHSDEAYLRFTYEVVRVWQLPVEPLLTGGLGTLPLAPIAGVAEDELPSVIRRMKSRLQSEASPTEEREIWASTNILMGLRYSSAVADELLKGIGEMKESTTYLAILREGEANGRLAGEREMLIHFAKQRLGQPSTAVVARLAAITSPDRLIELGDRLSKVTSWDELMPS